MRAQFHLHLADERIDLAHTGVGDPEPSSFATMPIGAVSLVRHELRGDPPRPEELTNAIGHVQDLLDEAVREMFPDDPTGSLLEWAVLTAEGPLVDTIAAVEIGASDTIDADGRRSALDGFVLTRAAAEDVFRTLATEPRTDRLHNPGLPASQVDTVVGASCIVVAVMRRLRSEHLTVGRNRP